MAVTHRLKPLSDYFHSIDRSKVIINDIPYLADVTDEDLLNHLMTIYDDEIISSVPRCECQDGNGLKGRARLGQICARCNSIVRETHDRMDSTVWLRAIDVVDEVTGEVKNIPFISPVFWIMLSRQLYASTRNKVKVDYLRYLCDDKYTLPPGATTSPSFKPIEDVLTHVMNGERSYLVFLEKFDLIFKALIEHSSYKNKKRPMESASDQIEQLYHLYLKDMKENRGKGIFTDYMPIINRSIFVMEKNPKGRYVALNSAINIDVVKSWLDLCEDIKERKALGKPLPTAKHIAREVARVVSRLAMLYIDYLDEYVYQKSGLLRKHLYGARTWNSARAVIASRQGPHDRRGIILPWCICVTLFQPHLKNKMLKKGYNVREITSRLYRAVKKFDQEIYELLLEIKNEAPNGRPPIIVHRNRLGSLVS